MLARVELIYYHSDQLSETLELIDNTQPYMTSVVTNDITSSELFQIQTRKNVPFYVRWRVRLDNSKSPRIGILTDSARTCFWRPLYLKGVLPIVQ